LSSPLRGDGCGDREQDADRLAMAAAHHECRTRETKHERRALDARQALVKPKRREDGDECRIEVEQQSDETRFSMLQCDEIAKRLTEVTERAHRDDEGSAAMRPYDPAPHKLLR
jgi:hypothetical protein